MVATADTGPDSMIVLWNVATGQPVHTIKSPHPNGVAAMDLTPDGSCIVTVSAVASAAGEEEGGGGGVPPMAEQEAGLYTSQLFNSPQALF